MTMKSDSDQLQIVFYERYAPLLRIRVDGAERFMNVSQLECFLVKHCFDMCGKDAEAYSTMVHGMRMLDMACAAYLKYIKTGIQDRELPVVPNRETAENSIL